MFSFREQLPSVINQYTYSSQKEPNPSSLYVPALSGYDHSYCFVQTA